MVLDELWAQEHLVKGSYLFHYNNVRFTLIQTQPWPNKLKVEQSLTPVWQAAH